MTQQVDGLHPPLEVFYGSAPVKVLSCIKTIRDTLDTIGLSEAVAVRVLVYILGSNARDVLN